MSGLASTRRARSAVALACALGASVGWSAAASAQGEGASRGAGKVRFVPAAPRLGDLVVVYVPDRVARDGVLTVFDHEQVLQRVDADLLRTVVAVPVDVVAGRFPVEIDLDGAARDTELTVIDRPGHESKLTVGKRFTEKPSAELRARLDAEERAWAALFKPEPTPPAFTGGFIKPVDGSTTSPFGSKRMFNGRLRTRHYGLDLDGAVGDSVEAAQAGKIVMSSMRFTSGGTIVIDHGNGLFSAYFHLSKRFKKKGQTVAAGERIGLVGATGRVTGPHLHLSVMVRTILRDEGGGRSTTGLFVDPERVLQMTLEANLEWLEKQAKVPG